MTAWVVITSLFSLALCMPSEDGELLWPWAIFAIPGYAAFSFSWLIMLAIWIGKRQHQRLEEQRALARCEVQHQLTKRDDPRGFYGNFTPAFPVYPAVPVDGYIAAPAPRGTTKD